MDHASKLKILKQLARTRGEIANAALEKEADKIAAKLEYETSYDLLEQQIELLDIFAFRVPQTAVEIVRKFVDRLRELEITHSNLVGWSKASQAKYQNKNRLLVEVLKLLDRIRYHRLEDILEITMSCSKSENVEVRKQAEQGLEHLAEYNIDIYFSDDNRAGFGPAPQLKVLDYLEALDTAEQRLGFSALTELCSHLLSPTMESTSSDYRTVTWRKTAIPATDTIKDIRRRSLHMLKELFGMATTTAEKVSVINAMLNSTRTPHVVNYGDDVLEMVSQDTREVLAFFKEVLPEENLQIVQKIEHDAFWRFRSARSDDVKAAALEIRDCLANNDEYTIYKDLIGFEGIFGDWEESATKKTDFGEVSKFRSARAKEYADSINAENWIEWRDRILRFAKTESSDLATFPNFFEFLRQLAEKCPNLAFGLLTDNLDDVQPFTIPLLSGLWKGPRKADLRALMLAWIAADLQLIAVTRLFISNDDIDEELLQILLDKGASDANRDILILIATVAVSNFADGHKDLVPKLFLPAVQSLAKIEDATWVNQIWYRKELGEIIQGLGKEGREIILSALLVANDIDYHAEELLVPLVKKNPKRIIEFFGERQRHAQEVKPGARYDVIPFQFHKLHETLADFPELAVATIRPWFDGNGAQFQYRGANLLKIIFPDFPEPFETKLLELVHTGERQDIEFVLSVLRNYEGEPFLHEICREIVATLPKNDEFLRVVAIILQSTGVVMGEFGFAEAYKRKIEEIKPWLTDENERVRKFSTDYVTSLEKQAKSERLRAQEEIELRKHAYGVREEEAEEGDGASGQREATNEGDSNKE